MTVVELINHLQKFNGTDEVEPILGELFPTESNEPKPEDKEPESSDVSQA